MDLASPDSSSGSPEKIMESPFGDQSGARRSKSSTKITNGLSFVASRFSTWRMSDTTRCRKPRVLRFTTERRTESTQRRAQPEALVPPANLKICSSTKATSGCLHPVTIASPSRNNRSLVSLRDKSCKHDSRPCPPKFQGEGHEEGVPSSSVIAEPDRNHDSRASASE